MTQWYRNLMLTLVLIVLPCSGWAQTVIGTHEIVDFQSPEGWAMAFMTASSLNLGQQPPQSTYFGDVSLSAELGSIPRLDAEQQQVGFGGSKHEDLNKSPVFGRARAGLGLIWDLTAELSWTPPLEVNGAKPDGLWGVALSRPLLDGNNWGLGLRLFAQQGSVIADVSCDADIAAQAPGSPGNIFGCIAPSEDQLQMDHYGGELTLSLFELTSGFQPWVSIASTRMDPFVEVNVLLENAFDYSTVDSRGTTETFSAGVYYRFSDSWKFNLGASYTPLKVDRLNKPLENDNFWTVKFGLIWDM